MSFAAIFFSVALALQPQAEPSSALSAAHRAEQAQNFAEAEAIYVRLLADHHDAALYQRLGLVRHMQNKFALATQAFKEAVRLDPSLWSSRLFWGIDSYRLNQFAEADKQLAMADRLHPNEPEITFWLGATKLARHDFLTGFELLESLLERDPSNAEVLRMLAESYAAFGTSLLNEVGEKYPDSPAGLIVQGRAFEFEGSYDAALEAYRSARVMSPGRPGLQESIARVEALRSASNSHH